MDCDGTTQDEELFKRGKLEMQRSSSNVEDRDHEEILRSERHCQRRRSSTEGDTTKNLEALKDDKYTGMIVDNLEKIVVFGKVR